MDQKEAKTNYKLWEKIIYFFPVQLLFVHLKKNLVLLIYWLILIGIITRSLSLKYGIPYLFLYPEYLGKVNFTSHFIMGLITGAFIMAFNLASYVVNGFRFSFLATLSRPFIKYCQNNLIIPIAFSLLYIYGIVEFQAKFEHVPTIEIVLNVLGFISGNLLFIAMTAVYFISTNKNVDYYLPSKKKKRKTEFVNPVRDLFSSKQKWKPRQTKHRKEWKVVSYVSNYGKIALARDCSHYKRETLERVFYQNRVNATVFQVIILTALFVMGLNHENEWLMIPAAGSILLFFTMLVMLTSAFYSWFRGWASIAWLAIFVGANYLSTEQVFTYENQAYGLNYDTTIVEYSQRHILDLQENRQNLYLDVENGLTMLQNWKAKTGKKKPIAVFLNVPGGGLRSALWTMESVNYANNLTQNNLWDHVVLISGSSGGMVGAAYLRELYYRAKFENDTTSFIEAKTAMSKDKLNPVAASAVLNDLFFRFKTFEYQGHTYVKDRAHSFENKLNADTKGWLKKKLWDYHLPELKSEMPMLLLSPTVSNDGRKMVISSQPISYLCYNTDSNQLNENIEFTRFFEIQSAKDLDFVSALRMSATFPYVFPAANLPTEPATQILDAGIRDNYGMSNTLKFIFFFKEWLLANTEKVVIIQVRDQPKIVESSAPKKPSLLEEATQPFGTFYNTVLKVQDYQMDDQLRLAKDWYLGEIEVVDFVLDRSETNPISLSWHLTSKEKSRIENALFTDQNQLTFLKLKSELTH